MYVFAVVLPDQLHPDQLHLTASAHDGSNEPGICFATSADSGCSSLCHWPSLDHCAVAHCSLPNMMMQFCFEVANMLKEHAQQAFHFHLLHPLNLTGICIIEEELGQWQTNVET
jgi:hypothetical protein